MIIYRKSDETVVIPCGLGPVVCPDSSHELQMKQVDSSTVLQQVVPDSGYYGLYRVIVNPLTDGNLLPGNIKEGVEILGVMGTYAGMMLNLQAKTANPLLVEQVITFDHPHNGLSSVTIAPVTSDIDPDIQAGNIKRGVEILGVTGTFDGGSLQSKTVNSSTASQTVEPDNGNYGLSSVTVNPYTLESKTQNITLNGTYSFIPSSADGLSSVDISVNVANIPAVVQSKSVTYNENGEYTVTPDQGYDGLSSVDISVNVPDIPAVLQEKTVNSSTESQSVTYDSGYDGLSSVTVEPYVLDSKTVNSSTAQQVITSSVDGLSSVTVEPYTLDSKTVNSSTAQQVITSDVNGLSSVTVEPYTLDSKMVDPSTSQQTVTSSADGLSSVTVNAVTSSIDPDIQAGNIKRGVEILGVTGTFDGGSLQSKEVNSSTNSQSVTPDSGYYGLSGVTVKPYTLESKTQNITLNGTYSFIPTSADGLSSVDISVNVADIPAVVQSKSVTYTENGEYTVTPDQGYDGLSSVDISVNIPPEPVVLQSKTVNSSTSSQSVTYDSGYDGLSSVTVEPYVLDSKTVNSSTTQQVITSDKDGLSSVTVEPYVLDSKTVNSSTTQQVITSSVDGLSSVTVEPYELDSKTVNSSTAQQVITSGKDGLSSVTVEPYVLDSKTVDPSTSQITVNSSVDGLSSVTVNAVTSSIDANISSSNIKRGVEILGVTGTFDGGSLGTKTVNSSTSSQTITPEPGDYGLSSVTVNPYTVETKSVTLTNNGSYTYTPTTANAFSSFNVDVSIDSSAVVNLQTKSITANTTFPATILPDAGYDGFSELNIDIQGVEYQIHSIQSDSSSAYDSSTYDVYAYVNKVILKPVMTDAVTVDASVNQQVITPVRDAINKVTVNAVTSSIDSNIQADNIKRGVEILGVTGALDGGSLGTKTVNSSTSTQTITPEPSDYGLSSVTVEPYVLDSKTVNSSTAQQVITSDKDGLSSVTVNPYTVETDSSTLTVNGTYTFTPQNADALSSITIDVSVEGQVINNQDKTVNSSTSSQTVTFDSGYTGLNQVTVNAVTSSIDSNITADNIKRGVVILGVTGTFEGGAAEYDEIYNALIKI